MYQLGPFTILEQPETKDEYFKMRKPLRIIDGKLVGSEIARYKGDKCWLIWTSKVVVARRISDSNGFTFRAWSERECELHVPLDRILEFAFIFGAKRRRVLSDEQREQRKARLTALRKDPRFADSFRFKRGLESVRGRKRGKGRKAGLDSPNRSVIEQIPLTEYHPLGHKG